MVTVVVLARTAPPAAPTATLTPAEATGPPAVRIVAPSPESTQELSQSMRVDPGIVVQTGQPTEGEEQPAKGELVVAPIPMLDPAIDCGLGVGAVCTIPKKKTEHPSPPATLSGGAMLEITGRLT